VCDAPLAVMTVAELRARGFGYPWVRTALHWGAITRVRRGVYARPWACRDLLLATAHGGTLACVSAARHLGLWVLDDATEVHVWLPSRHCYKHDGCECIEHWDDGRSGVGTMAPPVRQILRQILHCRGVEEFFVVLESALRQRRADAADLRWLRRHTNAAARDAIDLARQDADSGLESLLRWRLRDLGLSVRTQVSVFGVGRVDAVIGERLLIEVDGRDNHDGVRMRHKDLVRDANAASWGYTTLRFDYSLVVHDWELVEAAILGALGRRLS
jgi:very-short-patch-repair endonuclease